MDNVIVRDLESVNESDDADVNRCKDAQRIIRWLKKNKGYSDAEARRFVEDLAARASQNGA